MVDEREEELLETWDQYQNKLTELLNIEPKLAALLNGHYTQEVFLELGSEEAFKKDIDSLLKGRKIGLGYRGVLLRARLFYNKLKEQSDEEGGDTRVVCT